MIHIIRDGLKGGRETRIVKVTPVKAIRYSCLECCGWLSNEVKACTDENCPLYPYRLGKRPVS